MKAKEKYSPLEHAFTTEIFSLLKQTMSSSLGTAASSGPPGIYCVVESPSLLHRKAPASSSSITSSNPAVFVRPSSAQFQLQESLRQRTSQWIPPSDAVIGQNAVSASEAAVRPSTANTVRATSVRSSSAASSGLIRRQQAILAARNQQALTESVVSWDCRPAHSRGGDAFWLPRFPVSETSKVMSPSPTSLGAGRGKMKPRTAPKSMISAIYDRLRDSTFESPGRERENVLPSDPPKTTAAQEDSHVDHHHRQRHSTVSTISTLQYTNDCSEDVKGFRPFSFEQQHHDDVHQSAMELKVEIEASSVRAMQLRAFRSGLVRQSKDFWKTHPMPTTVDLNKLMPNRGNNVRTALRDAMALAEC